jgi:hypothetical protein
MAEMQKTQERFSAKAKVVPLIVDQLLCFIFQTITI